MKKIISLVLVLVLGLTAEVANADFTFGTPTNLGSTVNSSRGDWSASISADGLELYFTSGRPGGYGAVGIWVTTRATTDDDWGTPVNLEPMVNKPDAAYPDISADGLELYFDSERPGVFGGADIYVSTRATRNDPWGVPVNLGSTVNGSAHDWAASISADGLSLFFTSERPGGFGLGDIYVSTRATRNDPWGVPVNLGPVVNSSSYDTSPSISADGLMLYFSSSRPPGSEDNADEWVATRATVSDPWGKPVHLGSSVNSSYGEGGGEISADGLTLYFDSHRPHELGGTDADIYQVPILAVVDFNGDGIVDAADMCIMVDHWGENYPLCDIGPMPWGDGIVDILDLIVLAEHFEKITPNEEINVDEEDDDSQVELKQGQILVVTLESNPTTGYRWEVVETQESILEQMGEAEFKPSETGEPPLVGAGGWEIFRFKAISAGQMTLQLVYHRPWEEGVEPLKTFSIQVVVN